MKILKILFAAVLAAALSLSVAMADNDILTGSRPSAPPEFVPNPTPVFTGSLSASLSDPLAGVPGVAFDIWQIAGTDNKLLTPFKNSAVEIDFNDPALWLENAEALAAYAWAESIPPAASPTTDTNGSFKIESLPLGTYLIAAKAFIKDNTKYEIQAFLMTIPSMDSFEVNAVCKSAASPLPPEATIIRKVIKTWKNDSKRVRPESIEVELLKNGKVFDTVELSEDNDWRYTWEHLENNADWTVREKKVPSGYSVRTRVDGITVQLINTRKSPKPDYDPPYRPSNPSNPAPSTPFTPAPDGTPTPTPGTTTPTSPGNTSGLVDIDDNQVPLGSMPQAGSNWIPVILLAASGIFCIAAGLLGKNRENQAERGSHRHDK